MKYFNQVPETSEALKKLYKKLCLAHHPDVIGGSGEAMKTINHEYTELYGKMKDYRIIKSERSRDKAIKCIFTATRETDRAKLHLLKENNKTSQWLICWNYNLQAKSWDLGTYFGDFKKALSEFMNKCRKYRFNEVFENYR